MKAMQDTLKYPLNQLNQASLEEFVTALSGVFEHSPWVARNVAAQRPFASIDALHQAMIQAVETAGEPAQLVLINAHPELAGKAAVRGELTDESTREQSGAGLNLCTQEEFDKLLRLNATYRKKFGFPFILAVRGYDRHGIIKNFEARINHSYAEELRASLDQIYRIARFRLDDLIDA
ncbi:2-oxo-4-hydroxy-4-carboxy-5-ureidoimidazoline decarboxylase [Paraburkholderia bonniea]|uniref:2-oxo-4-hydroxy-4-carboxy-5-ureidoimidazoline decarboxylase n=1 Tax=Paraburkholderia bonniea TaxID=2152891 RepID=UPI001291505F|nr:2-oxo-4-hydroxy-4-carboxy-5-ureidoimidazoline decarboxylase [Paraburkholderia bonniea]WJF89150.1 2-oxo-4-hydroxy-4-carboxy-5-ureidoimidazoline decarboxylase [Paraburkholderia bonniea]WJF92466.1 2-oxo-4-hydroxy-4-carboxy-5-ureidoimidazoline decarboxylase [Paraburkholderia bonniea]